MTRDYAKRPKQKKKRPARRIKMVMAFLIAAILFFFVLNSIKHHPKKTPNLAQKTAPTKTVSDKKKDYEFDFYTILPQPSASHSPAS